MSHFCLLVIGDNVEDQLAPYQENNMGDCPEEYLTFHDEEEHLRKEYETEGVDMVLLPDGSYVYPWDEKFRIPGTIGTGTYTHKVPDGLKEVNVPFKEKYASFEEFAEKWGGYNLDSKTGRYGYWENPNAKWDWWTLGGRYSSRLKLKPGAVGQSGKSKYSNDFLGEREKPLPEAFVDQARFKDLDWEGMRQQRIADRIKWWAEYEVAMQKPDATDSLERYLSGIDPNQTKEQFITEGEEFSVFAILKDGKWYERGDMGWWGCVSNEKDKGAWSGQIKDLIASLSPDTLLTIVDCHI